MNVTLTHEWSSRLANAGFVFAVLVVMIHCHGTDVISTDCFVWKMRRWFPGELMTCAVPFFFLTSGFMVGRHCNEEGWWFHALFKRSRTLLLPYVSLNLIGYGLALAATSYAGKNCQLDICSALGISWTKGPSVAPLWYVRSLLLFVLCLPIVLPIMKRRALALVLIGALYFAFIFGELFSWRHNVNLKHIAYYVVSMNGAAYFLSGVCFAIHGGLPSIEGRFVIIGRLIFVICFIGTWCIKMCGANVQALNYAFVPGLIVGVLAVIPSNDWPRLLTRNSFPIFVFHTLILWIVVVIMRRCNLSFNEYICRFWFWLLTMLICVVVSVILAEMIRKSRFCHFAILGGR